MAFDSRRGRAVLFGGTDNVTGALADTWEWGMAPVTASTRTFGTGCGQPVLAIAPTAGSRPLLGTNQLTDVTNAPSGSAFMAVGLSDTFAGPFPLPLPLAGFGLPSCSLYHDIGLDFAQPCANLRPGMSQHSLFIPNNSAILNATAFLQSWAPAPGTNAAGLIVSNAAELRLGNN